MNPTPEALALARAVLVRFGEASFNVPPKPLAQGFETLTDEIAAIIDRELKLKECNAALAAAKALSDWNHEGIPDDLEIGVDLFCQLRDALAAIKTK